MPEGDNPSGMSQTSASFIGNINPIRYRGYYYDTDLGLYYLQSRYYDPETGRFLNADDQLEKLGGEIWGYNLYNYCFNDPVNLSDESGHWPDWNKWFAGAAIAVIGAVAVATTIATAGAAAPAWAVVASCISAAAGTACIIYGAAEMAESHSGYNPIRDGLMEGDSEAYNKTRNIAYTATTVGSTAASVGTAITRGLQGMGAIPIKVHIHKILNNPLDEFVTSGPTNGVISNYCHSIVSKGYDSIYAIKLPNGFYQLTNGHHRVAALRSLGYDTIKIFITK